MHASFSHSFLTLCCTADKDETVHDSVEAHAGAALPDYPEMSTPVKPLPLGRVLTADYREAIDYASAMGLDVAVSQSVEGGRPIRCSDFKLLALLGRGRWGHVYLAIHRDSKLPFAIKTMDEKSITRSSVQV